MNNQAPLRDFLDDINASLQEGRGKMEVKELDSLCQMLGVNGVNFVGDVKVMPVESLEFCGFPPALISAMQAKFAGNNNSNSRNEPVIVAATPAPVIHHHIPAPVPVPVPVVEKKVALDNCQKCHQEYQEIEKIEFSCSHHFCASCVNKHINTNVLNNNAVGITCPHSGCREELNDSIIRRCLLPTEYDVYLEKTFSSFVTKDESTFLCPNPKCNSVIAVQMDDVMIDSSEPIVEQDDKGRVLTLEAFRDFKKNRIRCRQCQQNFCAGCKSLPYHKGFTCSTFAVYGSSKQCRFCHEQLGKSNTAKNPRSESLADVCTEEECMQKMEDCCDKRLKCGCPCNGIRNEPRSKCLPCLKCELEVNEDYCSICYVEALEDAPCVRLGCKHIYHYSCVKQKIASGYSGARINFSYLECPADKKLMTHWALDPIIKPHKQKQDKIAALSLARLKHEGRTKDSPLKDKNSPYYNNPQEYSLHLFLFFSCFKCKNPYFAGGYQCQGDEAEFDPADLLCGACQPKPDNVKECKTHGTEWITFKCKYCCQFANFFCWGNCHFCNNCHVPGIWQKLVTKQSGRNKKSVWEYDQCEDLKPAIAKIQKQKKLTETQRMDLYRQLRCKDANCPLGGGHPPNGFEYGLGCSMCADKNSEDANMEAEVKAQRLETQIKAGVVDFVHKTDFDDNGALFWLGTKRGKQKWQNPATLGLVRVTSSVLGKDSVACSALVGRETLRLVTDAIPMAWFIIDLRTVTLEPTHYTIKHYSSWDCECLRNWRLSGSVDGKQQNWDTLLEHKDDTSLNKAGGSHTWEIPSANVKQGYRFFCLIQTGKNSSGHNFLAISGLELYGRLCLKKK